MRHDGGDSTTRRGLLKLAGSASVSAALAGCSEMDVELDSGESGEGTGTEGEGSEASGADGQGAGQPAMYGVDPERVTESVSDTAADLFHDVHQHQPDVERLTELVERIDNSLGALTEYANTTT